MPEHDLQEGLFPLGKPITPIRPLTARQMRIYELICAQPEGLSAMELGALLHEQANRHHHDVYCEWCGRDGSRVLKEKAIRLRLVRRFDAIYEPRSHDDWTGRAELGAPPPSSQLGTLPGSTWEDIFQEPAA
jgi:hypothetical protein